MIDENKEYLKNLPLRLLTLACNAVKFLDIHVVPKEIMGNPGFAFTFPPDHSNHDSNFHAPHPIEFELHTRSAQHYVVEAEQELERIVNTKNEYNKQLARGQELVRDFSPEDIEAIKLILKNA